eukprot:10045038-Karenia_brevis.AAC.1
MLLPCNTPHKLILTCNDASALSYGQDHPWWGHPGTLGLKLTKPTTIDRQKSGECGALQGQGHHGNRDT